METLQTQAPPTGTFKHPNQLRELGFYERFRVAVHDLGFHYNVSIIAHYSRRGKHEAAAEIRNVVFSAFETAIRIHPALGVVVVQTDTSNPHFSRLDRINLSQAITFRSWPRRDLERSGSLESFFAEENSRGFEGDNQPLWRAVVLEEDETNDCQTFSIAFIWHHVIGDGRSGSAVHSTLLDAIRSHQSSSTNGISSKNAEDWWVQTSTNPLLPPMEKVLSLSETTNDSVGTKPPTETQDTSQVKAGTAKWSGGHYSYQYPILTGIRYIRVPKANLHSLVTACRGERTTMTALLQAVVGKALFQITDSDLIRAACAISLRRFFPSQLGIDDSVMGLWISAFCEDYNRLDFLAPNGNNNITNSNGNGSDSNGSNGSNGSNSSNNCSNTSTVWERARHNTQRINFEIEKGDNDIDIAALRHISDFKQSLISKEGSARENSFGLTNLGVFPSVAAAASSASDWEISDLIFSQSCHANGSALQICIVTLEDGVMNIVFSWQRGVITDAFADEVASVVLTELMRLGSDGAEQSSD